MSPMTFNQREQIPPPSMPPGPRCAHCGTRVAENATTCFMCGADVRSRPRQRRQIPWSDIVLFAVVVGLAALWWTRGDQLPALSANEATPAAGTLAALSVTPTATPTQTLVPSATITPTLTPTLTPTPEFIAYALKSGDTLNGIANTYGIPLEAILKANNLTGREVLKAGQTLRLPTGGMKPELLSGNVTPVATATPDNSTLIYRVQKGDTLSSLATRFKVDLGTILATNKLDGSAILPIGQVLIIPRGTPTPTATPTVPMTPTPTPGFPLPAPNPLGPANGAVLAADAPIVLRWTAVGTLSEEDWYVVRVWPMAHGLDAAQVHYLKGTSLRLDHSMRLPSTVEDRRWKWQVVVARQPGRLPMVAPLGTPMPEDAVQPTPLPDLDPAQPLSAPSELRTFEWR